jgi:hypothetical protein
VVTGFGPGKVIPPPVAENPQTDRGWVVVVGGVADMPLTYCLLDADKTADKSADNDLPGSPQSIPEIVFCPTVWLNTALHPEPSWRFLSSCS